MLLLLMLMLMLDCLLILAAAGIGAPLTPLKNPGTVAGNALAQL